MEGWINANPTLSIVIATYVVLAGVLCWAPVRRPMIAWWRGMHITVYGPSLIDNIVRLALYNLGFEFFVFAVACALGSIGGWILALRK